MWTSRLFGKRNQTRRSSARGTQTKAAGLGRHLKERRLQLESLEQRQLLAITTIPILNPSFEAPLVGDGNFLDATITDWTTASGAGVFDPLAPGTHYTTLVPDGVQVAYSNGPIAQQSSIAATPNTLYELKVDVGDRLDTLSPGYQVRLYEGANLLGQVTEANFPTVDGQFVTATLYAYNAANTGNLRVELDSDGVQTDFDNVRLTATTLDVNAGGLDNQIDVFLDGVTGNLVVEVDGVRQVDAPIAAVPSLTINGEAGDDTLTVDFVNGDPVPAGGITFDGGAQTASDDLEILGGNFATVTYNASGVGAGDVDLDGSVIAFTGLEPVAILPAGVGTLNINITDGAAHSIALSDDAVPGDNVSQVVIDGGLESATFTNPTIQLNVNTAVGALADTVTLNALDSLFSANIGINTDGGDDTVVLLATPAGTTTTVNTASGIPESVYVGVAPGLQNTGVGSLASIQGNIVLLDAGVQRFIHVDNSGDATDRTWTIDSTGANAGRIAASGIGGTITFDTVAGEEVSIYGGSGDDSFTVDWSGGNADDPLPWTKLDLFGGGQGAGGDNLTLQGGTFNTVVHTFATANDGTVTIADFTPNNDTLNYFGLEPILDNLVVANRVFTFLNPVTDGELTTSAAFPATHTRIDSSVSESVDFTTATASLVVNLAAGSNTFSVTSLSGDYNTPANTINDNVNDDVVNFESTGIPGSPSPWTVNGTAGGTNTVNLSPTANDLNLLFDNVSFLGGAGTDTLNIRDDNQLAGDTFTVTSSTVDRPLWGDDSDPGASYDSAVEFLNLVTTGDGPDVINVNSTSGTATTTIDANGGDDTFNIDASQLGGFNFFRGGAGDDTFNVNITAGAGISAPLDIEGNANDFAGGIGSRDVVVITDVVGLGAVNGTITYTGGAPDGSEVTVAGGLLVSQVTVDTVETIAYRGAGGLNDAFTVVGTAASDDLISVAPITADRALVFNNDPADVSGPFNGPPEDFATRIPGVSGGSVRPDLDLAGLAGATGLTITDPGPGTGDRLYVYGESETGLSDGNAFDPFGFGAGQILPIVAAPASYDTIFVSDTATQIDALVQVNYNAADFIQASPLVDAAVVVNAGFETTNSVGPADDIYLTLSPTYKFVVNGGDPDPATTGIVPPNGDRLNIGGFFPVIEVWSNKAAPGQVPIVTFNFPGSGVLPFAYSSIEDLGVFGAATVRLIGDNNDPAVDQNDNFVVVGQDVDSIWGPWGDADGVNEFALQINGSLPIRFTGVQFLDAFGDDQNPAPGTPSVGPNDIDTLDIRPYADDTPRGWGIDVSFDEGNPVQLDGLQQDLLIYRTSLFGGQVSEAIVIQPAGPEHGEIVVTNLGFGTPIVDIDYVNNLDIVVIDDDGFLNDTDTLTLRGTNPDNQDTSGDELVNADFTGNGIPGDPLVSVLDAISGNILYNLRNFIGFNTINFELLGGDDRINIVGREGGTLTVNVDGGNPDASDTIGLDTTTGDDQYTVNPGASSDAGEIVVLDSNSNAATTINFINIEAIDVASLGLANNSGDGGNDLLVLNGTGGDDAISLAGTGFDSGTARVNDGPVVTFDDLDGQVTAQIEIWGLGGDDDLTVTHPLGGWQFDDITFYGGPPSGSDTFELNGTSDDDTVAYTASGANSGALTLTTNTIASTYTLDNVESAIVDADGESVADDLNVTTNHATITPGAVPGSGLVEPVDAGGAALLPLSYKNFELAVVTGGTVVVQGTEADDTITLSAAGLLTVTNNLGFTNTVDVSAFAAVVINALGGDDDIVIEPSALFSAGVSVIGGDNGTGSDGLTIADSDPIIDFVLNQITQVVAGPISLTGVEDVTLNGTDGNADHFIVSGYGAPTGVQSLVLNGGDTNNNDGDRIDLTTTAQADTLQYETYNRRSGRLSRVEGGPVIDIAGFNNDDFNLTIAGQGANDTLEFLGSASPDIFTVTRTSASQTLVRVVLAAGTPDAEGAVPIDFSNMEALVVRGGTGNDQLNVVQGAGGLIDLYSGVTFHGGDGDDAIQLTGGTAVTATYNVGPNADEGSIEHVAGGVTQRVFFTGLEPVVDLVPGPLTVNATNADNAISYTQGSVAANGRVAIDGFESYEFSNKTTLTLNALGGSDTINLNNPTTPTGLTGITVNAGDPAGSDTLIVNGIAGTADSFLYTPTGVGAGTVVNPPGGPAVQPTVTFSGTEHLSVVAQSADADIFRIAGTTNSDTFEVTPGASIDTFTVTGFSVGAGAFNFVPVTFSGVRAFVAAPTNFGPVGGSDTLIVNGTAADDVITLLPQTGFLAFPAITVNGSTEITFGSILGKVDEVILRGLEGNDIFDIAFDATTDAQFRDLTVRVEGGDSDASSDVLNYTGTGGNISIDFQNQVLTEVGFGPVAFTGVERLNVDAANADVVALGGADDDQFTVTPDVTAIEVFREGFTPSVRVNNVDEFEVDGQGGVNELTVIATDAANTIAIDDDEVNITGRQFVDYANIANLNVFGLAGDDTFNVTTSANSPTIFIDGGDPIGVVGDRINLTASGAVALVPGPESDEGGYTIAGSQPVSYDHIEANSVDLAGNPLSVFGTNADDDIKIFGTGPNSYTVSVNGGPATVVTNAGSLVVDGLAGDDDIDIDVRTLALPSLTVRGNNPSVNGDTLTVEGVLAGPDNVVWTPTAFDGGTLVVGAQTITVETMERLIYEGEDEAENLRVVLPAALAGNMVGFEFDSFSFNGLVTVNRDGQPLLPIEFQNIAFGVANSITIDGTAGGADTLFYGGRDEVDQIGVAASGRITNLPLALPLDTPGIEDLVLLGRDGNDVFDIASDHPFNSIIVTGDGPDAGASADSNGDIVFVRGAAGRAETITVLPNPWIDSETYIQGTGLNQARNISNSGVERIYYLGADGDDTLVVDPGQGTHSVRVDHGRAGGSLLYPGPYDQVTTDSLPLVFGHALDTLRIAPAAGAPGNVDVTFVIGDLTEAIEYEAVLGGDDTLLIEGSDGADDNLTVSLPPVGSVQIVDNGPGTQVTEISGALGRLELRTLGGDDEVTVDNSTGLVTSPIHFNGGVGDDTLVLTGSMAVTTSEYTPGATNDSGKVEQSIAGGPTQTVFFTGLEPVLDDVVAANLIINGTNAANAINYTAGPGGGIFGADTTGLVSVDAYETYEFSNKTNLTLNGLAGSDEINLNNPSTPTGLTGITVNGNDPTASDRVIVSGSSGDDTITYRPTAIDAGTVQVNALPLITLTTIEGLTIDGLSSLGNGDSLILDTWEIDGTQVLTPGSTFDSGLVDFLDGGWSTSTAPALVFEGLGENGSLTFTDIDPIFGTVARVDTLLYRGRDTDDIFSVDAAGQVLLNSQIPVNTPSIDKLVLAGLDGDDTFNVVGNHNLPLIVVEGGNPSASDVLNFVGTGGTVTVDLQAQTVTEVNPVAYTGIETINVDAGEVGVDIVATDADDDITVTVFDANSGRIQRGLAVQQSGQVAAGIVAPLVNYFNTGGAALTVDLDEGEDTLVVVGNAFDQSFTVDGALSTVAVDDAPNGVGNDGTVNYLRAESLSVFGLEGSDTFRVTGGAIPIFIDGGDPIGVLPGDTLILANAFAFFPGPESDEGGFYTLGNTVSFDHIESIIINPIPPVGCPFIILGTTGDDDITVIARDISTHALADGVRDFTVSVNAGPEIFFIDQPILAIDALAGDDDIVIRAPAPNNAPWDVNVTVIGGPPAAITGDQGDVLEVETPGAAAPEDVVYTPTGSDTGVMVITTGGLPVATITIQNTPFVPPPGCPVLPIPVGGNGGIETLIYDGQSFGEVVAESLQVITPAGSDQIDFTAGATADAASLTFRTQFGDTLLGIRYEDIGTNATLTLSDAGGVRSDDLTVNGRLAANAREEFRVGTNGLALDEVQILDATSGIGGTAFLTVEIAAEGVQELRVNGLAGDDVFRVAGNHPFTAGVIIDGGEPDASDQLQFVGSGGAITVELDDTPAFSPYSSITEAPFAPVYLVGIEVADIAAAGAALTVNGTDVDDQITYRPTGPQAGQFQNAGDNTLFKFTAVGGAFTINGLDEFADEVIVEGTNSHDVIYVDSPARTVTVEDVSGVDLKPVVLGATTETVTVKGRLGNDTILVVPAVGVASFPLDNLRLNNLRVNVDGGAPSASDALVIAADVSGTGLDNATHFVVVNHSRRMDEGVVRIFRDTPGVGNDPTQLPDISFVDIEIVSPLLANVDPVADEPNLLILGPDLYEQNEFRTTAAYIGSGSALNITNLAIFPNAQEHPFVPADNDFFRFVAQQTGTLDFQVYFQQFSSELLPAGGNLTIAVYDAQGDFIADSSPALDDDERVRIPVVAGQTYYLRVYGETTNLLQNTAVNGYDMTIVNTAPPVPYDLELRDILAISTIDAATSATNFSGALGVAPNNLVNQNDFYNGKYIYFLGGPNVGLRAKIVDYVGANGNFVVDPGALRQAPTVGDQFLIESFDTGRSQFDDVTRDETPIIYIRLDDGIFLHDLPGNPVNDTPPDRVIPIPFVADQTRDAVEVLAGNQEPGYRVAIFDEGTPQQPNALPQVPIGYARMVAEGVYVFDFGRDAINPVVPNGATAAFPLTDGSHFFSAKVQIIDPNINLDTNAIENGIQSPTGFGNRSVSLEVVVDTVKPPVSFGDPAVADDGLHPDSDTGIEDQPALFTDNITSDTTPTFWGYAEADAYIRVYVDVNKNGQVDQNVDVLIAETVAIPLDGTNQFPFGYWEATSFVDMNDPEAFPTPLPLDGVRQILVTAEDVAGNLNKEGPLAPAQIINIFIDTRGPQVDGVFVTVDRDYDLFDPKPSTDGPTPLVWNLDIDFIDQPVRVANGVDFVYPAVNPILSTQPGNYVLVGDNVGPIAIKSIEFFDNTVAGDIGRTTIRLNFFEPLPDDRYTLTVSDRIKDDAGNALDGETNTYEPQESPLFPSGDGDPGEDFLARFTVDSRPEIAVWAAGSIYADINQNWIFDPDVQHQFPDDTNRDLVFKMGFTSDNIFAGQFTGPGPDGVFNTADDRAGAAGNALADGFDRIGAYGRVNGAFRWLVDIDNDGVADLPLGLTTIDEQGVIGPGMVDPNASFGLPVAGNFDGFKQNGDEVGVFNGTTWWLDTNHDYVVDTAITSPLNGGHPIVGDFDGDGLDDLATWADDQFWFDLAHNGFGVYSQGNRDAMINFGFIGIRERPAAADIDQDGIDDLALYVPDRTGVAPSETAEWFILMSHDYLTEDDDDLDGDGKPDPDGIADPDRITGDVNTLNHAFSPDPLGQDLFAQFGDDYAKPILGNFDPPVAEAAEAIVPSTGDLAGTDGDDTVKIQKIQPGTGEFAWVVTVNGTDYGVAGDNVTINFDGLGGNDTVTFIGGDGADEAVLRPTSAVFSGAGYSIAVVNVESIDYDGADGDDKVTLFGSGGVNVYDASPGQGAMSGDGVDLNVKAETIYARGNGGSDIVYFSDSEGDDLLEYYPRWATMSGEGYFNQVNAFKVMFADAERGGTDKVIFRGTSANDQLRVTEKSARFLSGTGAVWHTARGFDSIAAYGRGGPDLLIINDTAGADQFELKPRQTSMISPTYSVAAFGFRYATVNRVNVNDAADTVTFGGSVGDDVFTANPEVATMVRTDVQVGTQAYFSSTANGFPMVKAYSSGNGNDVAYLADSTGAADALVRDDVFDARPVWSHLFSGTDYQLSTYLFAEVHAEAGEGHDVAMMNGSPGVDTLGASDTEVQISGVNVFQKNFGNYAKYFDEVITSAGDGEDTAVLLDGQAEAVDPSAATIGALADVAQALWLNEFEKIKLQNSGSSDESEINGVDEVFAYWQ